jgi:hypothetical protein
VNIDNVSIPNTHQTTRPLDTRVTVRVGLTLSVEAHKFRLGVKDHLHVEVAYNAVIPVTPDISVKFPRA